MVGVVVQQAIGQLEHGRDPLVGQLVVDDPVLVAGGDKAAPAQAGQVVGHLGLGYGPGRPEAGTAQAGPWVSIQKLVI
jgi:hypothetical protein